MSDTRRAGIERAERLWGELTELLNEMTAAELEAFATRRIGVESTTTGCSSCGGSEIEGVQLASDDRFIIVRTSG